MIIRLAINALSLLIVACLLEGLEVEGITAALVAALVLGIVNAVIRPVILLFTLPLNVLTLGLFTFVVNAALLYLVAQVVRGFSVENFWAALLGAILLTVVSMILSGLVRR